MGASRTLALMSLFVSHAIVGGLCQNNDCAKLLIVLVWNVDPARVLPMPLEFKSPVHRTAKRPETELDWTGRNWTAVASCLLLRMMKKTGCNWLQPHYVSNTYMV